MLPATDKGMSSLDTVMSNGGRDATRYRDADQDGESVYDTGASLPIDLRAIYAVLRRNLFLFVGIILLVLALGLTLTLLTTPTYVATSSVQIAQQSDQILSSTADVEPVNAYQDADRFLRTQTDILRSRTMAIRVARELNLFTPAFVEEMNEELDDSTRNLPKDKAVQETVIRIIQDNLTVNIPADSRVASISFRSPNPSLAAKIANAYATSYIEANLQRKYDSSAYARDFLAKQLVDAKNKLEASEMQLNQYAREAGLIDTSRAATNGLDTKSAGGSITAADLVQLNEAANNASAARIAAEERWQAAQNAPVMSLSEVLQNSAIQALMEKRAEAKARLEGELAHHRGEYPSVIQAKSVVDSLDKQIQAIASTIRRSIKEQYLAAVRQEESLNAEVQRLMSATQSEQDRSVRYNILAREVDTNRSLYDALLQRYKELSASAGATTNNVSIVDTAVAPVEPDSPNLFLNLALSLVLGMCLATLAVFAREQIDDVVRSPEDVERKLGIGVVGTLPEVEEGMTVQQALASPRSPLSEAYYALRSALLYSTSHGLPRSLLVTSTQPAEGKSTTSLALATDFAKLGKRTLLIDTDLRRPSLHRVLGLSNNVGLSGLLIGEDDANAIQQTDTPNLSFIASGMLPPSPTELLGGDRMPHVVREFEQQYDVVVLDGPPILGLADAPILASTAEAVLFVIEANRGYHGRAKTALRRLRTAHSNLLGAALTKFNPKQAGYSYNYSYDYYRYGSEESDSKA